MLDYLNLAPIMAPNAHGKHKKSLFILHETVSKDVIGWNDIKTIASYLAFKGYGIHGITDFEGHAAWAYGHGTDVYYHCGGLNEVSMGVEQVSWIPAMLQSGQITVTLAVKLWKHREKQLDATARLMCCAARAHDFPLRYVEADGKSEGVSTHWSASQHFKQSEGHTDCWPVNEGGYYPTSFVIQLAKRHYANGLKFRPPGV